MDPITSPPAAPPPVAPAVASPSPNNTLAKLSLADKIIGGGVIVGVVATFLPFISIDIFGTSVSTTVGADWRGHIGFLCILIAGNIAFLLLKNAVPASRNVIYALLGFCGVALLFGLLLMISALAAPKGVSVGFGTFVFLLSGLAVAGGGFLKAKDLKFLPGGAPPPPSGI